jgi:hypothetical protein
MVGLLVTLMAFSATPDRASGSDEVKQPQYRHAYYLFVVGPVTDGADRVIPLLLTPHPLDQQKGAQGRGSALIWTYERDSVSAVRQGVAVSPGDVKPAERHVRVAGLPAAQGARWYRYQSVSISEARELLKHPEGVIPAHRRGVSKSELDAILASLPE